MVKFSALALAVEAAEALAPSSPTLTPWPDAVVRSSERATL